METGGITEGWLKRKSSSKEQNFENNEGKSPHEAFPMTFENIAKPQLLFPDKIDNLSSWDPANNNRKGDQSLGKNPETKHPYLDRLRNLDTSSGHLKKFIDNLDELKFEINKAPVKLVSSVDEFEISTKKEDFVIDGLRLRCHLHRLNEIFTNPKCLKITIDASEKLKWLQRDYGVFCVNLLDLRLFLEKFNIPHSLPFLTQVYFGLSFNTLFVEFDFRKRPLSPKEIKYLQIFSYITLRLSPKFRDFLNSKINPNGGACPFEEAMKESTELCMILFDKVAYTKDKSYNDIVEDSGFSLNLNQLRRLEKLLKWRDFQSRFEDESREYVLPNQIIKYSLKKENITKEDLIALYKSYPSEIAASHLGTVHQILTEEEKGNQGDNSSQEDVNLVTQLLTPNKIASPSNPQTESPTQILNELLKEIQWEEDEKGLAGGEGTPEKKYKEILSRTHLSPSILKDTPTKCKGNPRELEDDSPVLKREVFLNILGIINNKGDQGVSKSLMQKLESNLSKKDDKKKDASTLIEESESSDCQKPLDIAPHSIEEIYNLANKNRKKNKCKKRKENKAPKDAGVMETMLEPVAQKKQSCGDKNYDFEELMKKLEWMS